MEPSRSLKDALVLVFCDVGEDVANLIPRMSVEILIYLGLPPDHLAQKLHNLLNFHNLEIPLIFAHDPYKIKAGFLKVLR